MSKWTIQDSPAGNQSITIGQLPDSTQRHASGLLVMGVSTYWGGGEFIYARFNGTVRMLGLVVLTPAVASGAIRHEMTEAPNTANLGRGVYIAMTSGVAGNWGWFMRAGMIPVNCSASVAADTAFGIVAAGQGGAIANGKQLTNARVILAAAATVVKAGCTANAASYIINVPNAEGWFIGAYLSGTGVGSGAKITDINNDGTTVTVDVVSTAAINGSVTATYNNATIFYNVAYVNHAFAQGQVS